MSKELVNTIRRTFSGDRTRRPGDSKAPTITIPLLLTKENLGGIIQPLSIRSAVDRRKEGWPIAITHVIEALAKESDKTSADLIKSYLPSLGSVTDLTVIFPSRGAGLKSFNINRSHLLSLFLGLHAVRAAEITKAYNLVFGEMGGWLVSAELRKDGTLRDSGHIDLKLELIYYQKNYWFGDSDTQPPLNKLLVSEESRPELLSFLKQTSHAVAFLPTLHFVESGPIIEVYTSRSSDQPWVSIHFAEDYQTAFETIYSEESRARLTKALKERKNRNFWLSIVAVGFIALLLFPLFKYIDSHYFTPATSIRPLASNRIAGITVDGIPIWSKSFANDVIVSGVYNVAKNERRFFVSVEDGMSESGGLYAYDGFGKLLFRIPPRHQAPFDPTKTTILNYDQVFTTGAAFHPRSGIELVALSRGDEEQSRISLISERGEILSESWYPNRIEAIMPIPGTSILVARGENSLIARREDIDSEFPPKEGAGVYSVLFAIDLSQAPRLCEGPPFLYSDIEDLQPEWYSVLVPRGCKFGEIQIAHSEQVSDETIVTIFAGEGYRFRFGPDGTIYSIELGDVRETVRPALLRVTFKPEASEQD